MPNPNEARLCRALASLAERPSFSFDPLLTAVGIMTPSDYYQIDRDPYDEAARLAVESSLVGRWGKARKRPDNIESATAQLADAMRRSAACAAYADVALLTLRNGASVGSIVHAIDRIEETGAKVLYRARNLRNVYLSATPNAGGVSEWSCHIHLSGIFCAGHFPRWFPEEHDLIVPVDRSTTWSALFAGIRAECDHAFGLASLPDALVTAVTEESARLANAYADNKAPVAPQPDATAPRAEYNAYFTVEFIPAEPLYTSTPEAGL